MDVIAAFRDVGMYRGTVTICGTTHETGKRIMSPLDREGAGAADDQPNGICALCALRGEERRRSFLTSSLQPWQVTLLDLV